MWVTAPSIRVYIRKGRAREPRRTTTSSIADAPADVRGQVFSIEAGKCVSYDNDLGPGWHHLVAMREGDRLKLFVDGQLVVESTPFDPAAFDLSTDQPLRIGFGESDFFLESCVTSPSTVERCRSLKSARWPPIVLRCGGCGSSCWQKLSVPSVTGE